MPLRSKVQCLPLEIRQWIDKSLAEGGFSDYALLVSELAKHGYQISKSSLKRYGIKLERKLAAIKVGTDAATAIAEAAPDDADLCSAAVMRMVQTELLNVLLELQVVEGNDDPAERIKLLRGIVKSVTELSRTSINQRKWQLETEALTKAETAKASPMSNGISDDTVKKIRKSLGIET